MRIVTLKAYPKFRSRYIKEQELYVSGSIYFIPGIVLRFLPYQYFAKANHDVLSKNS